MTVGWCFFLQQVLHCNVKVHGLLRNLYYTSGTSSYCTLMSLILHIYKLTAQPNSSSFKSVTLLG